MKFDIIAVGELKPDWESRLIQMGIMAPYSHIAVKVTHENSLVEVFECIGKGITKSTLDEVLDQGGAVIRESFELSVAMPERAYGWLLGRIGVQYSLIQFLGFIFPLFRRFKWIDNGRAASVCSEFGADFVSEWSDVKDTKLEDCDFISPRDLVEILQNHRNFFRGQS